jgi:hypothetical protein
MTPLGNLVAAALPGGTAIAYVIDGQQRRVGKKVNGFLVQGFSTRTGCGSSPNWTAPEPFVSRFVYDETRATAGYLVKGGVAYRLLHRSTQQRATGGEHGNGQIAQRLDYDAFGRVLSDTGPGFQPFGFAGGLYDTHTRLVRFGARDYDAEAGAGPARIRSGFAGGDNNLYAYVGKRSGQPDGCLGLQLAAYDEKKDAGTRPARESSLRPPLKAKEQTKNYYGPGKEDLQSGRRPCASRRQSAARPARSTRTCKTCRTGAAQNEQKRLQENAQKSEESVDGFWNAARTWEIRW